MSSLKSNQPEEGITIFGAAPSDVLAAFHASGLSSKGFSIQGRIVPHKAKLVSSDGASNTLFDGESRYAATFFRDARS